ncbi:WAS/WASL-interacting protein family member 1-like [Chroicocephalus ridibundus]|uniref:WAS/WASL-interacting protein family member 1-like n=1 Tax=Chroicocephalus ridibundus TaxID=1192867 RepID=UPI002FDE673B
MDPAVPKATLKVLGLCAALLVLVAAVTVAVAVMVWRSEAVGKLRGCRERAANESRELGNRLAELERERARLQRAAAVGERAEDALRRELAQARGDGKKLNASLASCRERAARLEANATALRDEVVALRRERSELARGKAALRGERAPSGHGSPLATPSEGTRVPCHPQGAHPGVTPFEGGNARRGWAGVWGAGVTPLSPSSRRGGGAGRGAGAGAAAAAGGGSGAAASAAGTRGAVRGPAERARSHPVRSLSPHPRSIHQPPLPTSSKPTQPDPSPSTLPALSFLPHGDPPAPHPGDRETPLCHASALSRRRDYAAEVDALRRRTRDRATGRRCPQSRYFCGCPLSARRGGCMCVCVCVGGEQPGEGASPVQPARLLARGRFPVRAIVTGVPRGAGHGGWGRGGLNPFPPLFLQEGLKPPSPPACRWAPPPAEPIIPSPTAPLSTGSQQRLGPGRLRRGPAPRGDRCRWPPRVPPSCPHPAGPCPHPAGCPHAAAAAGGRRGRTFSFLGRVLAQPKDGFLTDSSSSSGLSCRFPRALQKLGRLGRLLGNKGHSAHRDVSPCHQPGCPPLPSRPPLSSAIPPSPSPVILH